MRLTFDLPDEAATKHMAVRFSSLISAPLVLGLRGEIGAGKTTFIRAMLRALGILGGIKSPTYALVESYTINDLPIHHFDLYRIQEEEELDYIGFRDYFTTPSICCIEWPERIQNGLGCIDMDLALTTKGTGRELQIHAASAKGSHVLSLLTRMIP